MSTTKVSHRVDQETAIMSAISLLDCWFDTMRGSDGYGGPVAHWWQNCLQFTGVGLDWRYEGILIGYLTLYKKTDDETFLEKACCAGEDLIQGQLPGGNFRNSSFELNPYAGGTPHEAACDLALLQLAAELNEGGNLASDRYLATANRNIHSYYIAQLWDPQANSFRDSPHIPSFVPNKAATLVEAILALAQLTGDDELVVVYALPTLDVILDHQVSGGRMDGAIYQNSINGRLVPKFFPYYIARCIPALVDGYKLTENQRYLDAACRAMTFVLNWRYDEGSFPQVVYGNGQVNRYPQWIAAIGDILRVWTLLKPYGLDDDLGPTLSWMLAGQEASGGMRTAYGFASQISQRRPGPLPEFRDLLPVVGWNDKAFRHLATLFPQGQRLLNAETGSVSIQSHIRGQSAIWSENVLEFRLVRDQKILYKWSKCQPWADIIDTQLLWK